jgi:hypothetical protein
MYSPYYRQARPPGQPGQQRRFNKIQFSVRGIFPSASGTCSRIEAMYVSHQSIVTGEMPPICSTVRVSQNPSRLVEVISRYNLFVRWFAVLAPRAVLVTDLTVSESTQSEETARISHHCHTTFAVAPTAAGNSSRSCRRPPSVRDTEGQTTKPLRRKASCDRRS